MAPHRSGAFESLCRWRPETILPENRAHAFLSPPVCFNLTQPENPYNKTPETFFKSDAAAPPTGEKSLRRASCRRARWRRVSAAAHAQTALRARAPAGRAKRRDTPWGRSPGSSLSRPSCYPAHPARPRPCLKLRFPRCSMRSTSAGVSGSRDWPGCTEAGLVTMEEIGILVEKVQVR